MADTETADDGSLGGLGAMRLMMSGQSLPGQEQLDELAHQPIVDPSNKWLHFAAGALASTKSGRFSDEMSNALGGLAGSQDKEAELRAKYLPIIAQAMLQRQQMAITMESNRVKLADEYDKTLTGSLTGLLSQPNFTREDAIGAISQAAQSQRVPYQFAHQFALNLPADPTALRKYILSKSISGMGADARVGAVTPKIEVTNTGGSATPMNTNPNAPTPVGPIGAPAPMTLTPKDRQPEVVTTPTGPALVSKVTGAAAPAGTPEAAAMAAGATGGPAVAGGPGPIAPTVPGAAPGAVPPGVVPPGATPPLKTDLSGNAAQTKGGEDFADYEKGLNTEVDALRNLNYRVSEMREATKNFRGGATAEMRVKAGAWGKDIAQSLGVPDTQAAAFGNKIAGGDVGAMQEAQKLTVQGAMEALKAAAGTGQRFTQAEFAVFRDNNPNIKTDPQAFEKINNFMAEQYRRVSAEQNFVNTERARGTPVLNIRNMWNQQQMATSPPTRTTNVSRGTTGEPATTPLSTDKNGRRIKLVEGQWVYE